LELDKDRIVLFFNAFGYMIDESYLRKETELNRGDFRFYGEGPVDVVMTVGHALELIELERSWIRKYRIHRNENFSIPWLADRLGVSPVDVMRIVQTTSDVTATRKRTGVYFVNENDFETLKSMLMSEPKPYHPDLPQDTGDDEPEPAAAAVEVEEPTPEKQFTHEEAEQLGLQAMERLWETSILIRQGSEIGLDDLEAIGRAYVVSKIAEFTLLSGGNLEAALEKYQA
jgi:hypothetical protein